MPLTVSVDPGPIVTVPVFARFPLVPNAAPSTTLNPPRLWRGRIAGMVAPAPPTVTTPWLAVSLVPVGNWIVEPFRASQVPPVSVLPEAC